jgi:ribonucleoside-diphosphate reductase beta chain
MVQLTKQVRVFDESLRNNGNGLFEPQSGILFWDDISKQIYYDLYKEMRGNFWIPEEINMQGDYSHWHNPDVMSESEQTLFGNGIGTLASLDSIATQFDDLVARFIKNSAVRAVMACTGFFESIHNESYTYNMSSLVTKRETLEVFEFAKQNPFVLKRNKFMMKIFDEFLKEQTVENLLKGLVAMSALEGVCFVNGFTPFYHFMRNNKMFGTGRIIQYIQRDEVQHSYFQTILVRDILTQYPEYNTPEFSQWIYDFFTELVELEKEFCDDLYKDIYDIDIYEVKENVEFRANLVLDNLGLDQIFYTKKNPMPWILAFDPENANNVKTDFFEDKETNYVKPNETDNGWGEL